MKRRRTGLAKFRIDEQPGKQRRLESLDRAEVMVRQAGK
jgi:hypothetical protein